jgi:glycosyltransferase involved in cell wall biosynthesis
MMNPPNQPQTQLEPAAAHGHVRCSVVIPAYQGAAFLSEAIESVWRQTAASYEIIVVDDCSTEGTAPLADSLARRSPVPMHVIRMAENSGGPAAPINAGVRAAQGEYIAVLDQDDMFLPDKLASQARILAENLSVSVVVGLCARVERPDQARQRDEVLRFLRASANRTDGDHWVLGGRIALGSLLRYENYVFGYPGFAFRRSAWVEKGGVDETFRISSDYELLCWLCTRGDMAIIPRIQYLRRIHEDNLSRHSVRTNLESARIRAKYLPLVPELLADAAARELREWFTGQAYLSREQGHYLAAIMFYRHVHRLWGWGAMDVVNILKLAPHWLIRRFTAINAGAPVPAAGRQ